MDSSASFSYPRLIRRVQALLIDSLLVSICALGAMVAASSFEIKGVYAALVAGFVIFLLEPALVSFTGGTVGHHLRGLTVIHPKSRKKLNILIAILRFVLKVPLGSLSLITYFTTKRYQAFHDLISSSIVVLKQPEEVVGFEKLNERQFEITGFTYPSIWRQVFIVVVYNLAFISLTLIGMVVAAEAACQYQMAYCEETTSALGIAWEIFAILFFGASIYHCRYGRILGCRRKPVSNSA
jgi:uncharacterized RDD family membrane protein YckC